jgi:hypothetical protein
MYAAGLHRRARHPEDRGGLAVLRIPCSSPSSSPDVRRRASGVSLEISSTGENDAHASPKAASALAKPGPVVVSATPRPPVARAAASAA